jgi:hypothetical protein
VFYSGKEIDSLDDTSSEVENKDEIADEDKSLRWERWWRGW